MVNSVLVVSSIFVVKVFSWWAMCSWWETFLWWIVFSRWVVFFGEQCSRLTKFLRVPMPQSSNIMKHDKFSRGHLPRQQVSRLTPTYVVVSSCCDTSRCYVSTLRDIWRHVSILHEKSRDVTYLAGATSASVTSQLLSLMPRRTTKFGPCRPKIWVYGLKI